MTGGAPLAALRRIVASRPPPPPGERCDMCAEPVTADHRHVVDMHSRALMCTCRGCYLLFQDQNAAQRYRAIPDRYLSFPGFALTAAQWDELQIPVGLAFLFTSSAAERTVALYPSPAGATESDLPLAAWTAIIDADPRLRTLAPDVEALLIRAPGGPFGRGPDGFNCHLVPVDACYELVGLLRRSWRGFDGGQEARDALESFFTTVEARSKPVPS
jgi:hypothetical protein